MIISLFMEAPLCSRSRFGVPAGAQHEHDGHEAGKLPRRCDEDQDVHRLPLEKWGTRAAAGAGHPRSKRTINW
jgi:hypothetical protein